MTEDKTAITGYFDITEEEVIAAYADKHRLTESKALEVLVKKGVELDKEASGKAVNPSSLLERVKRLEKTLDSWIDVYFRCTEKTEKLDEQIAYLESEVDRLKR